MPKMPTAIAAVVSTLVKVLRYIWYPKPKLPKIPATGKHPTPP